MREFDSEMKVKIIPGHRRLLSRVDILKADTADVLKDFEYALACAEVVTEYVKQKAEEEAVGE